MPSAADVMASSRRPCRKALGHRARGRLAADPDRAAAMARGPASDSRYFSIRRKITLRFVLASSTVKSEGISNSDGDGSPRLMLVSR